MSSFFFRHFQNSLQYRKLTQDLILAANIVLSGPFFDFSQAVNGCLLQKKVVGTSNNRTYSTSFEKYLNQITDFPSVNGVFWVNYTENRCDSKLGSCEQSPRWCSAIFHSLIKRFLSRCGLTQIKAFFAN